MWFKLKPLERFREKKHANYYLEVNTQYKDSDLVRGCGSDDKMERNNINEEAKVVEKGSFTKDEAITKADVLRDISALKENGITEDSLQPLKRLEKAALSGVETKSWIRRLFFGFSLSNAVENWLATFNPSIEKVIGERLPSEETTNVVIAWMRFTKYRAMLSALVTIVFSSMVTIVTAYALYQQIEKQDVLISKQDKQISIQTEIERNKNIFLYLKTLYDETCEKQNTGSKGNSAEKKSREVCTPINNSRQRSEALKNYIALIGEKADLRKAHLEKVDLVGVDFQKADLSQANFTGAILLEANFTDATLWEANFTNAILLEANFTDATLWEANLTNAILTQANFTNAILRYANFTSADLKLTNFTSADLTDARKLECEQLRISEHWMGASRNKKLACGENIPTRK